MASVQCEVADREEPCACEEHPPPSLDILKEVHRVYEERMRLVERVGGDKKMQMQVEVLRSWVSDLVGQNTLLVRAVEELEAEATKRLHDERIRHLEREKVCDRKKMYDSWNELKILNDSLQKENTAKDREIRRLNKDVQQYEQTIITLKNKIALSESNTPEVSKKDAEVMVEMCGAGNDCGDWEPVKDYSALLCEETIGYQTRIHKLEADLKSTCDSVRTLRKMNTAITEELKAMRRVCAVLDEQCHAASARAQFKDDIIREMRRQLKQAKNKLKEVSDLKSMKNQKDFTMNNREFGLGSSVSMYDSVTIECVRQQPRRKRGGSPADSLKLCSNDGQSNRLGSADDSVSVQHD